MQITDYLYAYPWQGRANNCNSYLVKGKETILFDPGHIESDFNEDCLKMLIKQISEDGIELSTINLVLCTHGHPDHIEAAGLLSDKCQAKIGYHHGDQFIIDYFAGQGAAIVGRGGNNLQSELQLNEGYLESNPGKQETEKIEVIHTPGHSPGSVCFYLPEYKALISGDTVFENSIGRCDLPGGSAEQLANSIEKLSQIENVEYLLPGHMGYVFGQEKVKSNYDQIKRFFLR